jgi:hypothetical protein
MSGSSTTIIVTPRMKTGTIRKYSIFQSHFRCMKYIATSTALRMATPRMRTKARSLMWTVWLNRNDIPVQMARTTATIM